MYAAFLTAIRNYSLWTEISVHCGRKRWLEAQEAWASASES